MIYYTDLEKLVFDSSTARRSNKLSVVSGYVGPSMVKKLAELPETSSFVIVYGMYGYEGIAEPIHNSFTEIQRSMPNVSIYYSTIPVHSKIYSWGQDNDTIGVLIGSANFTHYGLRTNYREILSDVSPQDISDCDKYLKYVLDHCVLCTDPSVVIRKEPVLKRRPVNPRAKVKSKKKQAQPYVSQGICCASFLDKSDKVPAKSRINWGLAGIGKKRSHTSLGDAEIRITMDYLKLFPDLFPIKKYVGTINPTSKGKITRENDEIEMIWDDGTIMVGIMEGQNKIDGKVYPKQICSSPKKNYLGKYLRMRILGKESIDDLTIDDLKRRISKKDLVKYGRTDIQISKIGEGIYYMDFSSKKKSVM